MKHSLVLVAITAALFCEGAGRSALAQSTQHLLSTDAVPKGLSASEWSSIRDAYEAHRHEVVQMGGGYRARNPEQHWRTEFDGHGFITRPEAGDWQWGLELRSYGFPGQKRMIDHGAEVTAEGERVTYVRDMALREWFVNDQRGLEHGFTVAQRPAGANHEESRLEFDLAVRGSLHPEISADGETLRFEDPQGTTVLTYSGLKVTDADGHDLPARFAVEQKAVRLLVDERGARYPITIDPIAQQAYLQASNAESSDKFGFSVAVSGDTVVVGAGSEDSKVTGVNGDQNNNGAVDSGAAYVFVRNGTTWTQQAYLKASNTPYTEYFGFRVAVSADTAIVGAVLESSNATGIDGDQNNSLAPSSGAAYAFVRNGATWSQQAYLKASNTEAGDYFGISVAVDGETGVIGAFVEPGQGAMTGAAYIFTGLGGAAPTIPLLNISTRLNVGTGENVLIGGFIVVGTDPKKVILRAIGPSLAGLGVPDALADPILELHKPGNIIVTNDNWMDTQKQEIIDSTIPPTNNLESAIVTTLDPGPYTAIVSGKNNGTGIGLVEVYDLDQAANSQLANISTRGFVDIGDNVMIGGFIVGGESSTTVLVRAIGPSLGATGIDDPLQDPTLELHDADGVQIASDDNWRDTQEQEIIDTTIPPTDDREAAILADLTPAAYTAIVRGKNDTTGVGLMEVYNLQ